MIAYKYNWPIEKIVAKIGYTREISGVTLVHNV